MSVLTRPGRAVTATSIPARANSRATPAPIPRPPPVTSATPSSRSPSEDTRDLLERLGVLERRQVAGILAQHAGADGTAHDLRAAGLRERGHEEDSLRPERLPELRRDRFAHRARELRARVHPGPRDAEDPRHLALHLVRHAHRRSLGDVAMADARRLELSRPDPLPGDVPRV